MINKMFIYFFVLFIFILLVLVACIHIKVENKDSLLEMIVGEIYDVGVGYRVYEINGAEIASVIGNGWGM